MAFFLCGPGFLRPSAISASSKKRVLLGIPPRRFSQARSPAGPLRLWRGAIHSPSDSLAFLGFIGIVRANHSIAPASYSGAGFRAQNVDDSFQQQRGTFCGVKCVISLGQWRFPSAAECEDGRGTAAANLLQQPFSLVQRDAVANDNKLKFFSRATLNSLADG